MTVAPFKSPYPYFGAKSTIADLVWRRFCQVDNFVDPFFGSGAILLSAPYIAQHETVNDLNGFIANYWRATQADPDAVADAADWPVNEVDLHARHAWLVRQADDMTARLMGDPDYFDAKAAGWWLWGICQYIGSGWCSGNGPWQSVDGVLTNGADVNGIERKLPHLGNAGRGISRKLPHLGNTGMGQCKAWSAHLRDMMRALRDRLRRVRVCCGDWSRVCGPSPTVKLGTTAMFLDPPYSSEGRDDVYANFDNGEVFYDVVKWALANGDDPRIRIAVCGYYEEGVFPISWSVVRWKARGGYGNQGGARGKDNANRECVWFSPFCINVEQRGLWERI